MFLIDVVQVRLWGRRTLDLTFADQRKGVVAVGAVLNEYSSMFAPLFDPDYFALARVVLELGTVVWPNGADLCSDVPYVHAMEQPERLKDLAA
jgi:hypothetical protein